MLSQALNEIVMKLRDSVKSLKEEEGNPELLVHKRILELQKENKSLKEEYPSVSREKLI